MDAGDPHNNTAPRGQNHRAALIGVIVLLAVALGGLGLVLLLGDDGDSTKEEDTATDAGAALSDRAHPGSEPSESSQPSGQLELPESMAGSWEGSVTQESTGSTYTVEMTLSPTATDDQIGTVLYPTLQCSGNYTLQAVDEGSVTLLEHITQGTDNCVDEMEVTLGTVDADHLSYTFSYANNPEDGQATLTRSE